MKKVIEPTPQFAINLYQSEDGWVGHFLKDGVIAFDTGIPNSYEYVYARLDPWFVMAPHKGVA